MSELGKERSTSAHCQRGETLLNIPNAASSIIAKQVVLFRLARKLEWKDVNTECMIPSRSRFQMTLGL